ncbi:phage portal protein [Weissella hellenica]|nr:phage portal protein [Weissella hellenica]
MTIFRSNVSSVDSDRPVDIDFINKSDADLIQEHFLDRAIDTIYTKSNVANFNDDVFGNASGTTLEFKLQSMSNTANMKERKFKLAFAIGATLPLDMTGELAKNFKVTFKMKLLLQRQC